MVIRDKFPSCIPAVGACEHFAEEETGRVRLLTLEITTLRAGAAGAVTQPCVTAAHFAQNPVYLHSSARPDKENAPCRRFRKEYLTSNVNQWTLP